MRFAKALFCLFSFTLFASEDFIVDIPNVGHIQYEYEGDNLVKVSRLSLAGEVLYSHAYHYDDSHRLISETLIGDLGEIHYDVDQSTVVQISPYSVEEVQYDEEGNLIQQTVDGRVRSISNDRCNVFKIYDTKGNLTYKSSDKGAIAFVYDDQHRLSKATTKECEVTFEYDERSRRTSKTVLQDGKEDIEVYYYLDSNEIAIFSSEGELKQLRTPGLTFHKDVVRPVAIEVEGAVFAPIHDIQGNIIKLVNMQTKEDVSFLELEPFGTNLNALPSITPWIFACKHYDQETGLVYFGHRYYDPELKEWTTPDPLGAIQSANLYEYCFNNPLKYIDPDGRFVIVIPIVVCGGAVLGEALVDVAIVCGVSWLGYETVKHGNELMKNVKNDLHKKPKPHVSGKEGAKDVPSWAKGNRPYKGESGKEFAKRLLDDWYGPGNYDTGPGSEFNKIKKWGDRSFE